MVRPSRAALARLVLSIIRSKALTGFRAVITGKPNPVVSTCVRIVLLMPSEPLTSKPTRKLSYQRPEPPRRAKGAIWLRPKLKSVDASVLPFSRTPVIRLTWPNCWLTRTFAPARAYCPNVRLYCTDEPATLETYCCVLNELNWL